MKEILDYTITYGFPVVISIFLLVRVEQKIVILSNSIQELSFKIKNLD